MSVSVIVVEYRQYLLKLLYDSLICVFWSLFTFFSFEQDSLRKQLKGERMYFGPGFSSVCTMSNWLHALGLAVR